MNTTIFLIGGSGSGKTTLANQLISNYNFKKMKLDTTRQIRNEIDLLNYNFISIEEYLNRLYNDIYLYDIKINNEWRYGISKEEIKKLELVNGVIDIINIEPVVNIINYIKQEEINLKPIIVFFNISQKDRLQNLIDRGENKDNLKIRFSREDNINSFNQFNLKPDIIFNSYQEIELDKIIKLLKDK